jgi:hypothetical protein
MNSIDAFSSGTSSILTTFREYVFSYGLKYFLFKNILK